MDNQICFQQISSSSKLVWACNRTSSQLIIYLVNSHNNNKIRCFQISNRIKAINLFSKINNSQINFNSHNNRIRCFHRTKTLEDKIFLHNVLNLFYSFFNNAFKNRVATIELKPTGIWTSQFISITRHFDKLLNEG